MIQNSLVTESAFTNAQFHEGVTPTAVHHYSRLIYLRSMMLEIKGDTKVDLSPEQLDQIRRHCENISMRSADGVRVAVRHLKLPKSLRRHATTIAQQLWKLPNLSDQLSAHDTRRIYRQFREYENTWDRNRGPAGKFKGQRKYFPSYRVLMRRILTVLGLTVFLELFPLMRHKKLQQKNEALILALENKMS